MVALLFLPTHEEIEQRVEKLTQVIQLTSAEGRDVLFPTTLQYSLLMGTSTVAISFTEMLSMLHALHHLTQRIEWFWDKHKETQKPLPQL